MLAQEVNKREPLRVVPANGKTIFSLGLLGAGDGNSWIILILVPRSDTPAACCYRCRLEISFFTSLEEAVVAIALGVCVSAYFFVVSVVLSAYENVHTYVRTAQVLHVISYVPRGVQRTETCCTCLLH